ncbi:hypothetical protein J40TS1_34140 [Paenibacillus montaniterrae]|uniref:Prohead serine protease domain-containing protein n=1 Tax=Paenibacillus montaniterrae TaxID=429341 RepID=A0A919YR63_9BACL|nr:HK97 family phage prohead protease [Paenibacillus montaniterrae]GIP17772.1 hypothetical protein J40TS1_34140 [Paenibacillus montaniterrae]
MTSKEKNKQSPLSSQSKRRVQYDVSRARFRAVAEELDGVTIRKIRGYAILFDVLGTPWRGSVWKEKVSKTALDGVDLSSVPVLWDHNTAWVLGRAGKNARLEIDEVGLFVEVTLGNTWLDDYVFDRVTRELVDGMSFYFDSKATIATDWENKIDIIAQINEIYEVSVLAFPAYEETVVIAEEQEQEQVNIDDDEAKKAALINLIEQL